MSQVSDFSNLGGANFKNLNFDTLYQLPPPRRGLNHEFALLDVFRWAYSKHILRLVYEKLKHIRIRLLTYRVVTQFYLPNQKMR